MIKVIKPGFFSSIQDLGRIGYQEFGVPISGTMDRKSANLANALVGNCLEAAVLEITLIGPELVFNDMAAIAITGANMRPSINGIAIKLNRLILIKKNDILKFGLVTSGIRCYLSILGGFNALSVLKSASMYTGITEYNTIKKGDVLWYNTERNVNVKLFSKLKINDRHLKMSQLTAYKGPEFDILTEKQKSKLYKLKFTISKNNNRMAYQLNEIFEHSLTSIITSPVLPGTVQLTPSGHLIILMRDCQTTGGYPRVLQLSEMGINTLSQKYTGETICFQNPDIKI